MCKTLIAIRWEWAAGVRLMERERNQKGEKRKQKTSPRKSGIPVTLVDSAELGCLLDQVDLLLTDVLRGVQHLSAQQQRLEPKKALEVK